LDQAASICFENDRKSLSRWVSLKFEVRAPCRGDGSMPNLDVIEDTSEAHPMRIKDPGAVTRFQSGGFHASKMTGHPGAQHRGAWQSPWDQVVILLHPGVEEVGDQSPSLLFYALVPMPVVLPVAMSIVEVIDVITVLFGLVTASWTVDMLLMTFVRLMGHRNLLYDHFF
jgi:hypothetical protein